MFFKSNIDKLLGIKNISINGVKFKIKKIDLTSYLQGYNVLVSLYDLWNNKKEKTIEDSDRTTKKLREFYSDVFINAIVDPPFSKDGKNETVNVNELFNDWEIAHKLFNEIFKNTLKKKALKQLTFQKTGHLK